MHIRPFAGNHRELAFPHSLRDMANKPDPAGRGRMADGGAQATKPNGDPGPQHRARGGSPILEGDKAGYRAWGRGGGGRLGNDCPFRP
jgi:hypothetical protein